MVLNGGHALLLSKFARVDAAFGFLTKHRAVVSVKNVVNMANSLGGAPLAASDLHEMARVAPHVIAIDASKSKQMQHKDDVFRVTEMAQHEKEIVAFPCAPQTSQRASAKRKKLFQDALESSAVIVQTSPDESLLQSRAPQATANTAHNDEAASVPAEVDLHAISDSEVYSRWIRMLQGLDIYKNQIVHVERRPARDAEYRSIADLELPPRVAAALAKCNIRQLYSHQFGAIEAVRQGKNVVLSTSTASGKSLAYNIPMLASMLEAEDSTFLYLFPTKCCVCVFHAGAGSRSAEVIAELSSGCRASAAHLLVLRTSAVAFAYDGDTAMKTRSVVIRDTQIFLTNPDMLHLTILPRHTEWRRVLAKLKLLVVDEAHMYRGVFGSHVACVFKRLFRLCALYGANPQVVCCSATIQNPAEHFRLLLPRLPPAPSTSSLPDDDGDTSPASLHFFRERELLVITKDGSSTGEKFFCLWNPKAAAAGSTDESTSNQKPPNSAKKRKRDTAAASPKSQLQTRDTPTDTVTLAEVSDQISTSSIFQSAKIFARLMEDRVHTILFCRGRKLSELVLMSVHSVLREDKRNRYLLKRVSSYRGGYTLDDRRSIERRLFSGELLGVVATNALELGIDIGKLDCTMHLGLPSSIASLWQQAGRAGRKHTQQSVAVIICFDSPLDQHFVRHAPDLFQLRPEAVALNPANVNVLSQHLICAARESALFSNRSETDYIDSFILGDIRQPESATPLKEILNDLVHDQKLMRCSDGDGGGYRLHPCIPKRFRAVNLRSISEIVYKVVTDDVEQTELDEIPGERVFFQVYPTAVYLHQAQEYLVTMLDVENKVAYVKKCTTELKYFTACRDYTQLDVVRIQSKRRIGSDAQLVLHTGVVSVVTIVFGSTLLEKRTMRQLHTNEFSLPPMQSFGNALWIELPNLVKEEVEATGVSWSGALHGVGHLCIAVVPLFVLCEGADVNTEHYNPCERRTRPNRITIYERREGGSGIIEEIVKVFPEVIARAWTIADECACASGCPACIHSGECSEFNSVLDKRGSLLVLAYLHRAFVGDK